MSQSLAKLWVHLIFSTKNRYPFLKDKSLRSGMHAYLVTQGVALGWNSRTPSALWEAIRFG